MKSSCIGKKGKDSFPLLAPELDAEISLDNAPLEDSPDLHQPTAVESFAVYPPDTVIIDDLVYSKVSISTYV